MFINVYTHRNQKNTKLWRLSWFRYETFITFFKFRFFDTRRESYNFSMLTVRPSSAFNSLTQPTRERTLLSRTGPASPRSKYQLASYKSKSQFAASKSQRIPAHHFRAWRHSHPLSHFYLGFLIWHLGLSNLPRTRVNTCAQCVHLTNPCT